VLGTTFLSGSSTLLQFPHLKAKPVDWFQNAVRLRDTSELRIRQTKAYSW